MKRWAWLMVAACATTGRLREPHLETWPVGWSACSAEETRAAQRSLVEASDECGLGAGCDEVDTALDACAAWVPLSPPDRHVIHGAAVLVSTDEAGHLSGQCLAATSLADPSRLLACVSTQLAGITLPPSLTRAPLHFDVHNPSGAHVSSGRGLAAAAIMQTVADNLSGIARCAGEAQARGEHGKLVMTWHIDTSGRPNSAEPTPGPPTQFSDCIKAVIEQARFPAHKTQGDPVVMPFKY